MLSQVSNYVHYIFGRIFVFTLFSLFILYHLIKRPHVARVAKELCGKCLIFAGIKQMRNVLSGHACMYCFLYLPCHQTYNGNFWRHAGKSIKQVSNNTETLLSVHEIHNGAVARDPRFSASGFFFTSIDQS
jgi:hypothetical protein